MTSVVYYVYSEGEKNNWISILYANVNNYVKIMMNMKGHCNSFSIHFGILPSRKQFEEYKRLFNSYNQNFIGISKSLGNYVYISHGSWSHKYTEKRPTIKGRYKIFESIYRTRLIPYKNMKTGKVIIFVQNYSENEYWYGWNKNDIIDWIAREKIVIDKVLQATKKTVYIKFHPNTEDKYITKFLQNMSIKVLSKNIDKGDIVKEFDCCVVNSGTTGIYMIMRGIPVYFVNDEYSTIPVHWISSEEIDKMDNELMDHLPNQRESLDRLGSQYIDEKEYIRMIRSNKFSNK